MLDRARVTTGERVLVTGASGGVGSALLQLARVRGAIPYAVTSPGKEAALLAIGAESTILRDAPDLVGETARTVDGPVDVVADLVAGPLFGDLLRILRPEGRYITAGAIGGPVVELDLRTVYLKHLELHGSSQGTRTAFRRLLGHIESGAIRPLLDRTFRLSELHDAQRAFLTRTHIGKLVVVPDRHWDAVGAPHAGGRGAETGSPAPSDAAPGAPGPHGTHHRRRQPRSRAHLGRGGEAPARPARRHPPEAR